MDLVRIDSIYNPVRRANFTVAETRVGPRTDFDRLVMTVETDGTISPEDAVAYAAALLQEHFKYFFEFSSAPEIQRWSDCARTTKFIFTRGPTTPSRIRAAIHTMRQRLTTRGSGRWSF